MRVSRSARRAGSKVRIERGPRGGVSAKAPRNTTPQARASARLLLTRPAGRGVAASDVGMNGGSPRASSRAWECLATDYNGTVEVAAGRRIGDHRALMSKGNPVHPPKGRELISLAQKLARDAERHALLSASLASQA